MNVNESKANSRARSRGRYSLQRNSFHRAVLWREQVWSSGINLMMAIGLVRRFLSRTAATVNSQRAQAPGTDRCGSGKSQGGDSRLAWRPINRAFGMLTVRFITRLSPPWGLRTGRRFLGGSFSRGSRPLAIGFRPLGAGTRKTKKKCAQGCAHFSNRSIEKVRCAQIEPGSVSETLVNC